MHIQHIELNNCVVHINIQYQHPHPNPTASDPSSNPTVSDPSPNPTVSDPAPAFTNISLNITDPVNQHDVTCGELTNNNNPNVVSDEDNT